MDIDPELKYCPQCDDEYLAAIENCAACGIRLLTGQEMLQRQEERQRKLAERGGPLTDDEDLVNIHRGPLAEIKHLENLLDGEGIASMAAGDENSCGAGCCRIFFLRVRQREAEEALAIMARDFRQRTGLDSHDTTHVDVVFDSAANEAVCPACGCRFATTSSACPDCGLCLA